MCLLIYSDLPLDANSFITAFSGCYQREFLLRLLGSLLSLEK